MVADRIPLTSAAPHRLAQAGLDQALVFRHAGVPLAFLAQARLAHAMLAPPAIALTTRQYFALWRAIEVLSGDPSIGLQLGADLRPDRLDPATAIALRSDTFGDALRRLARYKRLVSPEAIVVERTPDGLAALQFRWRLADPAEPPPAALIDAAFAGINTLARLGAGKPIVPHHVELARTGDRSDAHAHLFQCEVMFGAARNAIVYRPAALAEPFLTRERELITPQPSTSVECRVSSVLTRLIGGRRPSIQAVARELGLSSRTLQRRLREQGLSYQAILDRVRQNAARHMLDTTDLSHGEIAFYLGFEEVNSFMRAFHQWERSTPAQWRARKATA